LKENFKGTKTKNLYIYKDQKHIYPFFLKDVYNQGPRDDLNTTTIWLKLLFVKNKFWLKLPF